MSIKETYEIELNDRQLEYIERMRDKHDIPDNGKVVRCLIDFAMHEPNE